MLLTEEQAREKWCPFTRVLGLQTQERTPDQRAPYNRLLWLASAGNDPVSQPQGTHCIASDCMAWRFARPEVRKNWSSKPEVPPPVPNDNWEPYGDVYEVTGTIPKAQQSAGEKQFERQFIRRTGYCGLAGKAET